MNALLESPRWTSPGEYLETEETGDIRHEYLDGDLYAMADTTADHNRIAGDIFAALHSHLRGKTCEPFINDMKARIAVPAGEWFYYPDVMVNCDPAGQQKMFCDTPSVIFEVLSPSTRRIDLYEKLLAYQSIAALHTYVIVVQDRREVSVFRRSFGWVKETLPAEGTLGIPELDFSLPLDAIYARVSF